MAQVTHKALFEKLRDNNVIAKSVMYAHWTLPQTMADLCQVRDNNRASVERDYQEVGALLVSNLAAKLARLLFPATTPFFRLRPTQKLLDEARSSGKAAELASSLSNLELEASQRLFLRGAYAQLILALKHLIISGNVLLFRDSSDGSTMAYGLQSFAIKRDNKGNMLDCVLREFTSVEALPLDIQNALRMKERSKYSRPEQQVEQYTRIKRQPTPMGWMYEISQQVDTLPVGEPSTYPDYLCPWQAPTWSLIPGEHYGRGLVEDYAGGFAKLSDLSESAALYSVELMRVVHLVGAGSGTDIDDLATAEHGEYVRGDPESVHAHESGDSKKLEAVEAQIEGTFGRLARAFMYRANTRDAERVTAFELKQDAEEAEHTLGGAYSSLAASVQVPLAAVLLVESNPAALEGLVSGDIRPHIIAGIPALGRSADIQNLILATQEAGTIVPALMQIDNRFDPQKLVDLIMAGRSVDSSAVMRTKEEQQKLAAAEAQQRAGQQQLMQAQGATDQLAQLQDLGQIQ